MKRGMSARLCAGLLAFATALFSQPCSGASGFHLPGARGSALGGISVVGKSWSPLRVAALPSRGYELRASWARPYGIDDLEIGALTLRGCSERVGAVISFQMLRTPTPFSEVHIIGSGSLAAEEGITLGAGLDFASLRDLEGAFAKELSTSLGLTLGVPGGWEVGFAAFVPASGGSSPTGRAFENGGYFRWGVGIPFARPLLVLIEEERRGRETLRRLGAELAVAEGVALWAGVVDSPFTVSFGIGLAGARTALDLSIAQHKALGATPCVTLSHGSAVGVRGAVAAPPAKGALGS